MKQDIILSGVSHAQVNSCSTEDTADFILCLLLNLHRYGLLIDVHSFLLVTFLGWSFF